MRESDPDYEEILLDEYGDESGPWASVIFENQLIAYIQLSDRETQLFNPHNQSTQTYKDFLYNLDTNRMEAEVENINSYDIIERAYELNPGVLHNFAGNDFSREIDVEIMQRFDEKDAETDTEDIGGDFDMLFEGMNTIMDDLLEGRLDEFKATMDREKLVEQSTIIYGENLQDLYTNIHQFQLSQDSEIQE